MVQKVTQFFNDVRFEMKKVSWPTWDELRGSTYVVLSLSLLLGIFLFLVDRILSSLLKVIL